MNDLATENRVCACGRAFTHCKNCGSKNVYPKKARSFEESEIRGKVVYVFGCRKCMREFTNEQTCVAPSREFNPEIILEQKQPKVIKQEPKPWGNLVLGSEEYLNLFSEEACKKRDKKRIDLHEACAELIREGWPLSEENMDDELKAFLRAKGLLTVDKEQEASMRGAQDTQSPPSSEASLDEIIKAMNEEQK